jgi:hypothetical protein
MSILKKRFFGFSVLTILIVAVIAYFVLKKGLLKKAMGGMGGGNGGEMPGPVGAVNAT